MKTIPSLERVAGVVFYKFSASMKMVIEGVTMMVSPVERVSHFESSRTELRFSTHTGSIGESKIIHFLSGEASCENSLITLAKIPSFQSELSSLMLPISY
jgi:hypothetical protein